MLGPLVLLLAFAAPPDSAPAGERPDPFRQLEEILPTPTSTRAASGAPGHEYWQQDVDYKIEVEVDDDKQRITGSERITYRNSSPDTLDYLWLQLDANIFAPDSDAALTSTGWLFDRVSFGGLKRILARASFDGSIELTRVESRGKPLDYKVVKTMMRIDLPKPLKPGRSVKFDIDWNYAINEAKVVGGRTGFERFDDGNIIYEIAQWFPRLVAYEDVNGWQHKQFLGAGEFTLEFGDYDVSITAPADHIVGATGELANAGQVLTPEQRDRLAEAKDAKDPVFIVTPEEAADAEAKKDKPTDTKTWRFKAKNVRDFAFASSRKFIWDAQTTKVGKQDVLAMSYYPNEGEPLWSRYSTRAIVHTLKVYSRYTFEYPYPTAISVNGPIGGMEYPMICFNGPRPEKDGTYGKRTKYGLISVIIHEVGHNFFPMIVNSDERQWTWMDEGLNTFLQYLAEQEWEEDYPSRRGEAQNIVDYMTSEYQVPIMTNSESLLQFGNNAYAKPATALNILRETVLGRELFDYAFKEYAQRWQFKRPMPSDFFRTLEDASGVDLDWFWRGWFYSTKHVDIGIKTMSVLEARPLDPRKAKALDKVEREDKPETLSQKRNKQLPKLVDEIEALKDFYNDWDELDVTQGEIESYEKMLEELTDEEKKLLESKKHFTHVVFENVGGLVMPIIVELELENGAHQEVRIPAEIWRRNPEQTSKVFLTEAPVVKITLDPHLETADTDLSNNHFPPQPVKTRFEIYKDKRERSNPMQDKAKEEAKAKAKAGEGKTGGDKDAGGPEDGDAGE